MNDMKPTHAVKAVIRNSEGKILFLQRKPDPKMKVIPNWDFPGGIVELGEEEKSALQREIQEELGVDSVIGDEVGKWTFFRPYDGQTVTVTNYAVELLSQDIILSNEHADFQWVSFEDAKKLPVKDQSLFNALKSQ
jgi:8-oxo-dGTP diphosphatase